MRFSLFTFMLIIVTSAFSQTQKVSIKGFGEISATKIENNTFNLDFGKYGKFLAKGTLDPIAMEIETTLENIREFPGYKLYEKLDLQKIILNISQSGVSIDATLDTKKNFGDICKMFKIPNPTMGIKVAVSKTKFKLEGELDFEDKPIIINIVPNFSRFIIENLGIEAEAEAGEASLSLGFSLQTRWRPTEWDPDIQSVIAFSYNLPSNEIAASISMTDTWTNPMLFQKILKPNSVVFSDVAASLDWPLGAPAPSAFGFNIGQAKFFQLDFAVQLAMTPADKQIALYAYRNELTMNDFSRILRDGFGLKVPDVFPQDMYIKDAKVLFSPNGGEVGEFEIDKGFAIKGDAKLLNAMNGKLDFILNGDDGFYLDLKIDASFKEALMNEIRKVDFLAPAMGTILSTFEVRKILLHLEASTDLLFNGKTDCHFKVMGKDIKFAVEGKLDVESIKNKLIDEIKKVAGPEIAAAVEAVGKAFNQSKEIASKGFGDASKLIGTAAKHTHSKATCDNECVPNLARQMAQPIINSSRDALTSFYNGVINKVANIEGVDVAETKKLRREFIRPKWNELCNKIDDDWNKIRSDRTYVGYYLLPSSATNGGNIFRRMIYERRKVYESLKNDLWNKMMTAGYYPQRRSGLPRNVSFEWEKEKGTYDGLYFGQENFKNQISAGTNFEAGSIVLMSENKQYILKFENDGSLVLYKYNDIPILRYEAKNAVKFSFAKKGYFYFYKKDGKRVFSKLSNLGGLPGYNTLRLQNDGNLERVNEKTGKAISFKTGEIILSNKAWLPSKEWSYGPVLVSQNKIYSLEFKGDGNLVLMKYGVDEIWSSGTAGKGARKVNFQDDGNLVLYTFSGGQKKVIWASNSNNRGGETLYLQNDGRLVIHAPGSKVVWEAIVTVTAANAIKHNELLRLRNVWKGTYINIEQGLKVNEIGGGAWSSYWILEPVDGATKVRIKNRWKGTYLNIESGHIQCTQIEPGWSSAVWIIEQVEGANFVRIKNEWKGTYLNIESGHLQCTPIQPGWASALWGLVKVIK